MREHRAQRAEGFRHEALFYAGDDAFDRAVTAFVREGQERDEPTLVVVAAPKLERLRDALGPDTDGVWLRDMHELGHNPARIIPAWHEFVEEHDGRSLRGVGEPIGPERNSDALAECHRHEALLNLAFAGAESFWLMCPYDTAALDPAVVAEAEANHLYVRRGGRSEPSSSFGGLDAIAAPFEAPLPAPPTDAAELRFGTGPLGPLRAFVEADASRAGLGEEATADLVLASAEVAANSIAHGAGDGVLRMWATDERVICEISDSGFFDDPLAGRKPANVTEPSGRGLWTANQLCDLVQIRSLPDGTVVRLHMARG